MTIFKKLLCITGGYDKIYPRMVSPREPYPAILIRTLKPDKLITAWSREGPRRGWEKKIAAFRGTRKAFLLFRASSMLIGVGREFQVTGGEFDEQTFGGRGGLR